MFIFKVPIQKRHCKFLVQYPPTPAKNYQNDNFYTYNGIAIKEQTVILTKSISETSCEIFYYYKSNEYLL